MSIWIFIWRLNPPHIWHMRVLNYSLRNDNKILLFLGSSNIKDNKNPYSFKRRKEFINILYKNNKKLIIEKLDDFEDDNIWVEKIKDKLSKYINFNKEIIFYWWDFKNDYAIKVIKRYKYLLWFKNISFKEINRKDKIIEYNNKIIEISSTNLREAIKKKDKKLIEKLVSKQIIDKVL